MNLKVLIVEDEKALAEILEYNFKKEGYVVDTASDGEIALDKIIFKAPDLIILDWMLPKLSGIELCRKVRTNKKIKNIPIIMLTARGEEEDRLKGLEMGADDYVTKPFSINELLARAKAVLKRIRPIFAEEEVIFEDIKINIGTHKVFRNSKEIKLGPTEFNLLRFFMENISRVFSRQQLLNHVWKHDALVEPRTVDVHVRRLRKSLNAGNQKDFIRTVRSAGYSFGS
ncbi:phosphate regulon transcriptional regulator PhoB [Alphaproteobacteria bacterium]|jgi:two-component system phosphate regulon response regulator PhoB|nr:phosphate regulon transcriptional regulator PhoB [Alphaproteobacteria bacterium]MDC1184431.1 phosphate regulon transcriptional regulator PhoB [Alphaproteobacteria bacterium]